MNHGPLVFLAAFFALATSWVGFVLAPQLQVGQLQQTNAVVTATPYPIARPGLAREGLQVYRANGCNTCHSQQVGQTGTVCDVVLTEAGTNLPALTSALANVKPGLSEAETKQFVAGLPKPILEGVTKAAADKTAKAIESSGAKAKIWIVPTGPDIARGWGKRRSVAQDFIFDYPVMPGSQRIGPDLADVGRRLPDVNWHLRHLYAPQLEVKGSLMPPYRYLFDTQKVEHAPSPEALQLPRELAPAQGYEIVPTPEAKALAAYLVSLRADAPLFAAPFTVASAPQSATANAPAAGSTNAPPVATPAK